MNRKNKKLKERNFTPKIIKNDKYKITMSFEDRRLKSIELKNKYKKAKKPENNENNNVQGILTPGEMVRFKEIKLDININNNEENILKCNDNNKEIKENNTIFYIIIS